MGKERALGASKQDHKNILGSDFFQIGVRNQRETDARPSCCLGFEGLVLASRQAPSTGGKDRIAAGGVAISCWEWPEELGSCSADWRSPRPGACDAEKPPTLRNGGGRV